MLTWLPEPEHIPTCLKSRKRTRLYSGSLVFLPDGNLRLKLTYFSVLPSIATVSKVYPIFSEETEKLPK